ncbi:MAG TPA: hypothetical protein VE715_20485 [Blastocatellia bacterium]|nr:hypothetical protein [Blastocatellia bacterium]
MSEQGCESNPHQLLFHLDSVIPPRFAKLDQRLEVGFVSQSSPIILVDESAIVSGDPRALRACPKRILQ